MNRIPNALLLKYVSVIRAMANVRQLGDAKLYAEVEAKRRDIHNDILLICEAERGDERFARELAQAVEEILCA